jgi:hypothetical protein
MNYYIGHYKAGKNHYDGPTVIDGGINYTWKQSVEAAASEDNTAENMRRFFDMIMYEAKEREHIFAVKLETMDANMDSETAQGINKGNTKALKATKQYPKRRATAPIHYLFNKMAGYSNEYGFNMYQSCSRFSGYVKCVGTDEKGNLLKSYRVRRIADLATSTAVMVVDIDAHDAPEILPLLEIQDNNILMQNLKELYPVLNDITPACIVLSGHGMHLWFKLQVVDLRNQEIRRKYLDTLSAITKLLHGDAKCVDVARIFRTPYSCNAKKKDKPVKVSAPLWCNEQVRYDLQGVADIIKKYSVSADTYKTDEPVNEIKKQKNDNPRSKKSSVVKSYKSTVPKNELPRPDHRTDRRGYMYHDVLADLETLAKKRMEHDCIVGMRNAIIFCYSKVMLQNFDDFDKIMDKAKKLNASWKHLRLSDREVENIVSYDKINAEKIWKNGQPLKDVHITVPGMAEFLQVTENEQSYLRQNWTKEASDEAHAKRQKAYRDRKKAERIARGELTKKQKSHMIQIQFIQENKNMSRRQIMQALNVSESTAKRLIKEAGNISDQFGNIGNIDAAC